MDKVDGMKEQLSNVSKEKSKTQTKKARVQKYCNRNL